MADGAMNRSSSAPSNPVPQMLWVRHRGSLHQVPLCPDIVPYSTVALMRMTRGWQPGDPTEARIHNIPDGTELTVTGSGLSAQDSMFCPEMETQPLPECHCEEAAFEVEDPR